MTASAGSSSFRPSTKPSMPISRHTRSTGSIGKIGAADAGGTAMNWLLVFVPITIALEYLAPELADRSGGGRAGGQHGGDRLDERNSRWLDSAGGTVAWAGQPVRRRFHRRHP